MIAILQEKEAIKNMIDIATTEQLTIGGVLLLFIVLLITQIKSNEKKYEKKEQAYLDVIAKKDIELQNAYEGRMKDLRMASEQLISLNRSTDKLIEDIKHLRKNN